jgi:CheY-like chemotaxis protein
MATRKILLVDDEVSFIRLLKLNLEQTGKFEVRTENKGSLAVQTAKAFKPDLILLDIIMPDMDGSEVASRLKNDPATRDIPILFLTALVKDQEVASKSGTIGGFIFLAKPITTEELITNIDRTLGESNKSELKLV